MLRQIFPKTKLLDKGIRLLQNGKGFDQIANHFRREKPIYIYIEKTINSEILGLMDLIRIKLNWLGCQVERQITDIPQTFAFDHHEQHIQLVLIINFINRLP